MYARAFVPTLAFLFTTFSAMMYFGTTMPIVYPILGITAAIAFYTIADRYEIHWLQEPEPMTIISSLGFLVFPWVLAFYAPPILASILMWPIILAIFAPGILGPFVPLYYFVCINIGVVYVVGVGKLINEYTKF